MILGIGTDIVDVKRIESRIDNINFVELVFLPNEIAYCMQGNSKAERFAGKFAAKEAFFKALGTGIIGDLDFKQVNILNNKLGKPSIEVSGAALLKINQLGVKEIFVSISHERHYATAFVILEC